MNTKGLTTDEDMRNCILQGAGFSLPAELLPQVPTYKGITFKLPQVSDGNDLLVARGETLELPKGCTKLYFLAASTAGDRQAEFATDRRTKTPNHTQYGRAAISVGYGWIEADRPH